MNARKTEIARVLFQCSKDVNCQYAVSMDVDMYAFSTGQTSRFEHLKIFQDLRLTCNTCYPSLSLILGVLLVLANC